MLFYKHVFIKALPSGKNPATERCWFARFFMLKMYRHQVIEDGAVGKLIKKFLLARCQSNSDCKDVNF
jgi:hypothetical protein